MYNCPDHAPERTWRHLDTMQFETRLRTRMPRANGKTCGVKRTSVPWAGKHSRFTLMFEAFAVQVIQACGNVKNAAGLLGLDWDSIHRIMERAIERGIERRELESLQYLGMDEKSFRRGHSYVSLLTDLTGSRVLEVVEDRTEEAANDLWKTLSREQKEQIEAGAVDMWPAFANSVCFEPVGNGISQSFGLESHPKRGEFHEYATTMFQHGPEGNHP